MGLWKSLFSAAAVFAFAWITVAQVHRCDAPRSSPPPLRVEIAWDGTAPIYPEPPWDVDCMAFSISPPPGVAPFRMCIRPQPDVMSNSIRNDGRWRDCDALLGLWNASGLFLDIGANIGTCTLLMLAAGARVAAFEPLPANLHYLTRSLFLQPASFWRGRLSLYPVGLGRATSEHYAGAASRNSAHC